MLPSGKSILIHKLFLSGAAVSKIPSNPFNSARLGCAAFSLDAASSASP